MVMKKNQWGDRNITLTPKVVCILFDFFFDVSHIIAGIDHVTAVVTI